MLLPSFGSSGLICLTLSTCVAALGQIEIHNQCHRKVFYDAVLGSKDATTGIAPAHEVQTYAYGPVADGLSIKFGFRKKDVIERPFQVEITRNYTHRGEDFVYYDVSSLDGNPMWRRDRAIIPTDPNCGPITCHRNKRVCEEGSYHRGQDPSYNPVEGCSAETSLKVYLCALGD